MKNKTVKITMLLLLSVLTLVLFACAHTQSMVIKHPTEVEGMPICSECHTDWRAALDHANKQACDVCHKESFCSDCHAHKEELKPSDKYKDSPQLAMPHRGDYLNQHKIDGSINPASCFPCHGRQNNGRCSECHK
jgi:hypothetical protein